MSVQVKLGRWRTRDGSVAEVTTGMSGVLGYPWAGTFNGNRVTWNCAGEQAAFPMTPSKADLIEYLGPLEPAPFDLAAFIAGLKPGDYYADKRGVKYCVMAVHEHALWVKADHEKRPFTVAHGENSIVGYPAGPWVEPPTPQVCYVSYDDSKSTFRGWDMHLKRETAERSPHARELIWTEGKGFELGEVIKQ